MAEFVKKIVLTIIALSLSVWLVAYGLTQKSADKGLVFEGASHHFWGKWIIPPPRILYEKGLYTLTLGDYQQANRLFNQAVKQDLFHMESWLRLVETQAALGNFENAGNILVFSVNQTDKVMRWKWQQAILAQELGLEELFVDAVNMLLRHPNKRKNTFQLITDHYQGRTPQIIAALSSDNMTAYLKWLMRWDRLEDSKLVWDDMVAEDIPEKEISLEYIHFLLEHKQITKASEIWRSMKGDEGITNGGFEHPSIQKAFGWYFWNSNQDQWRIHRTISTVNSGAFALQVDFLGKENLDFWHISQVVPVREGQKYLLIYDWKSRNLTTDQGPFVEVSGYGECDLYEKGNEMLGNNLWREEQIKIDVPAECQAIIIRISRRPSKRINSMIAGTLWLDDFHLKEILFHE